MYFCCLVIRCFVFFAGLFPLVFWLLYYKILRPIPIPIPPFVFSFSLYQFCWAKKVWMQIQRSLVQTLDNYWRASDMTRYMCPAGDEGKDNMFGLYAHVHLWQVYRKISYLLKSLFRAKKAYAIALYSITLFLLREAAKKGLFSGPVTKALPPPLELSGHNVFLGFKKKVIFLSGLALTPPPSLLVAGALKKDLFSGFPFPYREFLEFPLGCKSCLLTKSIL